MTRTIIFAALLAASMTVALTAPAARAETIWIQPPGTPGLAPSQFSTEAPIYAEVADDFVPTSDYNITGVTWWGRVDTGDDREQDTRPADAATLPRDHDRYLNCSNPELLPCGSVVSSTNALGHYDVEWYSGCSPIWHETGPEMLYELPIPGPDIDLTVRLTGMTGDLDLFLLTDCSEDSCLANADSTLAVHLDDAGTYFLVVEGYQGATSPYTLSVDCAGQPAEVFAIRVYLCHPLTHLPTDLIGEAFVTDFAETQGPHGLTEYSATIDPVQVSAGQRYCVSVQMVSQSLTEGEWFWAQAEGNAQLEHPWIEDARLSADRWTSFANLAGFPGDWDYDMAFELGGVETPVERRNWGTIKALYR